MTQVADSSATFTKATVQGTTWRYLTFFTSKAALLISTAVLARLLSKDDFGVMGYALTAINFLDIFSDMGIGPALIYYPENKKTASTAFWLNLLTSLLLCGFTWVCAPLAAVYFRDERATEVIRMLSLVFPIIALGSTHQKLIEKKLAFNRTFLPEFLRSLTKGGATIAFAFLGYGVWSLILGQLCSEVVSTVAYWISSAWMPGIVIDRESARSLLSYGFRYVGADAVAVLLLNLDYLLVGRYLGAVALGVYTLAFRLPDLVVLQFARTLSGVVFPVYSRMRETSGDMARGFLLTTRYISLITVPLGAGLALVAKPFTELVFSDKWVDAVPAIQGLAIYSMLLSLAYNAGGAYKASGRPQIITWLGLIRVAMLFPALWWAVSGPGTIVAVSWMHALVAFISALLSLHVAARVLNIGVKAVYAAVYPAAVAGCVMAAAVYGVLILAASMLPFIQLLLGFFVGGIVYVLVLWFFQRDVVVEAGHKLRAVFGQR